MCHCGRGRQEPACRAARQLVLIAEDEFARLERLFLRIAAGDAAALDRRMTDAVLEPERFALIRQRVAVLPPNFGHARKIATACLDLVEDYRQPVSVGSYRRDRDVDVRRSERLLPVLWSAVSGVAKKVSARGHAFLEFLRKAVER